MTRFGTAVGGGKYSLSFETDNYEHFQYMQLAARHCVDGHVPYQQLLEELTEAKTESERLEKEVKMYASVNDSLIEDNEALQAKLKQTESLWKATAQTLQDEIDQLRAELADERDRFDRLSDFELAEAKELAHAKLMFNIAFSYLDQTGYDVERLGHIVALRTIFEERGLV